MAQWVCTQPGCRQMYVTSLTVYTHSIETQPTKANNIHLWYINEA